MGGALGLKDPNALYIAMLKSRTITEKIVQRFDLKTVYDRETVTDTIKILDKQSTIISGKDGIISVEIEDNDIQRSAGIANAYVEELNNLMKTLAISEASQRRQFFEMQMKPAKDRLTNAEVTLDRTPNTSLKYLESLRNMKFEESIYQVLVKQYEIAKLDEAKNAPLIQIMDKAILPEKKSKPKRSLIVILSTLLAFFLGVIGAFVRESFLRSKQNPEQVKRMLALSKACKFSE
jgi:uncharacterized protein involved in exopolysaccharide biosynthesis